MQIRKINNSDIENVSRLHKKVFDSSYFSVHFSLKMLIKYFENLLIKNDYNYLVTDDEQRILGFLIGGYQTQKAVDEFMRNNKLYILICMLKKPTFILSGIKKIFGRLFFKKQESKSKLRLFLIGVDPESNSKGIGSLLINEFEKDLLAQDIHQYGLYVRQNNHYAIKFYQRKGFMLEFTRSDLMCYLKNL